MSDEGRARALLDALVRESSPSPDRRERSLAAVEARIVAELEAPHVAAPAGRGAPELLRFAALAIAIAAAVLLVIRMAAFGVAILREDVAPAEAAGDIVVPPPPEPAEPREPAAVVAPRAEGVPAAAPVDADVAVQRPSAKPPASAAKRDASTAGAVETGDLGAEAALIRAAKSATNADALALLDRHAEEFPRGVLAREREMIRAERLCALGRGAEARAVAKRFLADGSDDPLARRMRRVCPAK